MKKPNNDTVAYIVVSWNNKKLLDECIESIQSQIGTFKKRLIVVDNNSEDGTVNYLSKKYPNVEIIAESKNHGFAKGNNIGISYALQDSKVKYIVLLNTDARIKYNWTQTLVDFAKYHPKTATLQSITLDYYNHSIIDSTHIYISRIGQGTQGSWRDPISTFNEVAPCKVFGCNAAAMLITRNFIEAQPFKDFFDETMFMYLEDVDIAARATIMGWDNYIVPETRAYHMGSVSSNKKNPSFSLYMTFRNNTGLIIKNLPTITMWHILFSLLKADRAAIKHLRRIGKSEAIPAIIKGRLKSIKYIPEFYLKRRKLKPLMKINEDYLWKLMRTGF